MMASILRSMLIELLKLIFIKHGCDQLTFGANNKILLELFSIPRVVVVH
jgi:hypothetical protein